MKTAEEYAQRLGLWAKCDRDELREALLAAYRQGCTDAADISLSDGHDSTCVRRLSILTLRDRKKLEDVKDSLTKTVDNWPPIADE